MTSTQTRFLYLVAFTTGITSLGLEMAASRLLGNVFGNSNLVWASIIGLILIYLSLGYYLGGRLADRSPKVETLYQVIAWAAFSTAFIPLVSKPILRLAADAFDRLSLGILFGSFSSVLILFLVPVTLFGTVSPFVIRLLIKEQETAGKISGQIYSISTLGSFLGTFLPVLVLIPLIGTNRTIYLFSGLSLGIALVGFWQTGGVKHVMRWSWMVLLLVLFFVLSSLGTIKKTSGQIFETESAYNYIQVIQVDGYHYLRLNEGQGIHSMWHPTQLFFNGPWEQFLAAPFFNLSTDQKPFTLDHVQNMAIIGLAAGTTARQATAVFGSIPIDGFEIDPEIIRVGQEYFGMTTPNLNAIPEDGRWGLAHSQKKYTIIAIDAYRPPYIPWYLTTVEFFQMVSEHLTEDGAVAINVGRAPRDRRLVDGFVGTMSQVFPSIYIMDLPGTFNSIIYATKSNTKIENLYQNLLYFYTQKDINPILIEVLQRVVLYQQPLPNSEQVFTDDLAPIEWMTNNLVLNYLFTDDFEAEQ